MKKFSNNFVRFFRSIIIIVYTKHEVIILFQVGNIALEKLAIQNNILV